MIKLNQSRRNSAIEMTALKTRNLPKIGKLNKTLSSSEIKPSIKSQANSIFPLNGITASPALSAYGIKILIKSVFNNTIF